MLFFPQLGGKEEKLHLSLRFFPVFVYFFRGIPKYFPLFPIACLSGKIPLFFLKTVANGTKVMYN